MRFFNKNKQLTNLLRPQLKVILQFLTHRPTLNKNPKILNDLNDKIFKL